MNYRATPLANGYSPSELLFGRKIKTALPQIPSKLKTLLEKENNICKGATWHYNRRRGARNIASLKNAYNVYVKNLSVEGEIAREANSSYVIDTPRGRVERNRRHLAKLNSYVNEPIQNHTEDQTFEIPENPSNDSPSATVESNLDPPLSQLYSENGNSNITTSEHYITKSGRLSKPPDKLNL